MADLIAVSLSVGAIALSGLSIILSRRADARDRRGQSEALVAKAVKQKLAGADLPEGHRSPAKSAYDDIRATADIDRRPRGGWMGA